MDDNAVLQQNIIEALDMQDLTDEQKAEFANKVMNVVQKRVMVRVMELLADEDDDVIKELSGDFGRLVQYLKVKVPNFDEILKEEIIAVKTELLEVAEEAA